jgi:DNA-binding MarR family transcriptional regulator
MINKSISGIDRLQDGMGFLFWQVSNVWEKEIKRVLEQFDLSHAQLMILSSVNSLSQQKESVTQILLSEYAKIDPMTTSKVVRSLQNRGYIKRKEYLKDTRAKTVHITEKGQKLLKDAFKEVDRFDKEFFSNLNKASSDFNKKLASILEVSEAA